MIRHIKKNLFLVVIFIFFSCKEKENINLNSETAKPLEKNINTDISNNSGYITWHYYPSSEPNKDYEEIKVYISNDSIKIIKKEDLICQGEIVKEKQTFTSFFKNEKTGNEVREKLTSEYGLNVTDSLLVIMNAYGDVTDKGCSFPFHEIFIIDNHLFFYDKGYQCFVLNNNGKRISESNVESLIKNSNLKLPYDKKIDIQNVQYEKVNVKSIKGLEDFSCEDEEVRYLSLPSKGDISLILVPQDCADFKYNFQLLSIKNNKVVSNLYVEGEWFEPENFEDKEITNFTIDKNYLITITTNSTENGKMSLKEKLNYKISEEGVLKKI